MFLNSENENNNVLKYCFSDPYMDFLCVSIKKKWTHEANKMNASFINSSPNLKMLNIILERLLLTNI